MELDGVHIFIILMLALMCSSCLGSFMREGYENSNIPITKTMMVKTVQVRNLIILFASPWVKRIKTGIAIIIKI
jgi:hypothetical protein